MNALLFSVFSFCLLHHPVKASYNISLTYVDYTANLRLLFALDVAQDELSGIVWFRNTISNSSDNGDNIFYAISDDLVSNKGWVKYSYNGSDYSMTALTGTVLGDSPFAGPSGTDSESIAVLGLPFASGFYQDDSENTPTNELNNDLFGYFVIGTEGHRTYDAIDHIMLYDMNGSYIKEFEYPALFNMTSDSGNANNGGFEALDISDDYTYIVYANERVLIQDNCTHCHRIAVSSFNSDTASSLSELTMTNEYMLRYDTIGVDWWIVDMVLLNASKFVGNDDAPSMPALILEGDRVDYPGLYNIFLVDLGLNDNDDILDCWSIGDNDNVDCNDSQAQAISKMNVFNFSCKLPATEEALFKYINFESMAIYDDGDNTDECFETLVVSTDNGGFSSNYFVTYEIDYCGTDKDKQCVTSPNATIEPTSTSDDGGASDDTTATICLSLRMTVTVAISLVCLLL